MTTARSALRTLLLTLAALLAGAAGATAATHAGPPRVDTTSGRLQGLRTAHAVEFLGVPYARPPVGRLRFAPPQPVRRAPGLVRATRPGPACAQTGTQATASLAEDCLFLNVTEPAHIAPGARLPIMVWSHGGGYTSGSGAEYGAQRLADTGHVIVITINKRLGIFGYLGLPGLRGGGDFGLLDVVQALRWTHANARVLGGDPHDVTLFGESDGAMSTCALLTSPLARGLVQRAAMSSGGSCNLNWPAGGLLYGTPAQTPYVSRRTSDSLGVAIAKRLGCTGAHRLACLRRVPTRRLRAVSLDFSDVLAYDTPLLPRNPAAAVRTGHVLHIPVISGGNAHEENSFVAGVEESAPGDFTAASYPTLLTHAFGPDAGAVAAQYPLSGYPSAADAFASLITDDSWACATLAGNQALARHTRVYAYEFDDPDSPNVNGVQAPGVPQGSAHATDLPYLFDLGGRDLLRGAASRRLSRAMIAYWTTFARTGRPRAPGQPAWPAFSPASTTVQGLDASGIAPVDVATEHRCAFWQSVNPSDRP